LQGREVDTRADIFSFGCVLHEILTGKRAFDGTNAASVIAAVMERPAPSVAEVAPAALDRVLKICLAKDADERWQSARDVKWNLAWIANGGSGSPRAAAQGLGYKMGWIASGVLALLLAGLASIHYREKPPKAPLARFSILPPEKGAFNTLGYLSPPAISPDGQRVVFSASGSDGMTRLWVRSLDAINPRPLAGTEDGVYPFWSPDGKSIGFFADQKLKRIEAAGGPALALADALGPGGGTWNRDGVIVFAPLHEPLMRVSASGGVFTPITKPNPAQDMLPWFLPDGKHFLFAVYAVERPGKAVIRVGSLESPDVRTILEADSNAIYAADPQASTSENGYLLFARGDALMVQPFDAKRIVPSGEATAVTEVMGKDSLAGQGAFSVSANGTLIYVNGVIPLQQLTWTDRSGRHAGTLGAPGQFMSFHTSPDAKAVAVDITDPTNPDIWIYDAKRGLRTRFTFDPATDEGAVWSPNGRTIVFSSNRKGHFDLYRKASNGAGSEELLYADGLNKYATSWSPDGKFLLYYGGARTGTGTNIWVLPAPLGKPGAAKPYPFLEGSFNEGDAKFSPDGKWIAYDSDETGRFETYVTAFPGPGGKRQISTGGGGEPFWGRGGKEILYGTPDNRIMAVEVTPKGSALEVGEAHALFAPGTDSYYDISPDGQRFLFAIHPERSVPESLTLVQNWITGLKK
jgi:eukaryotic-like serine/threonine-protein kinase